MRGGVIVGVSCTAVTGTVFVPAPQRPAGGTAYKEPSFHSGTLSVLAALDAPEAASRYTRRPDLKTSLLEWLVCPACKHELRCAPDEQRATQSGSEVEVLEGRLTCNGCEATYPILRGIPRMAPRILLTEQKRTANAFGYEWQHFDSVQDTHERQFLEWIDPLQPAAFKGKVVLDAGCGMGRHTYVTSGYGATAVIGIDLSEAVEAAYRNTSHLPNAHIVQADINRLPFRSPFDLIYSVGVLHHLPDPAQGFASLTGHLREGGQIAAWVYGAEGNFLVARILTPIRETLTSRLPLKALHALSWIPAAIAYPFLKTVFAALNRRPDLRRRVAAVPYLEYLCYLSDFGLNQLHSIVFDHLAPSISFYLTRRDVEGWLTRTGLVQGAVYWHKRYSWRLQGTRGQVNPGETTQAEKPLAAART